MTGNAKKWTGWILLFIAATPLLIVTGFLVRQKYVQHEMAERLEKTRLHTVTAGLDDVRWVKKDKEVEINGHLFDVKSYHINGNKITLTGLYDTEEQGLKKELSNLLKHKKGNTPPLQQLVFKFFNAAAVNETGTAVVLTPEVQLTKIYRSYDDKLSQQFRAVITPPPNV